MAAVENPLVSHFRRREMRLRSLLRGTSLITLLLGASIILSAAWARGVQGGVGSSVHEWHLIAGILLAPLLPIVDIAMRVNSLRQGGWMAQLLASPLTSEDLAAGVLTPVIQRHLVLWVAVWVVFWITAGVDMNPAVAAAGFLVTTLFVFMQVPLGATAALWLSLRGLGPPWAILGAGAIVFGVPTSILLVALTVSPFFLGALGFFTFVPWIFIQAALTVHFTEQVTNRFRALCEVE